VALGASNGAVVEVIATKVTITGSSHHELADKRPRHRFVATIASGSFSEASSPYPRPIAACFALDVEYAGRTAQPGQQTHPGPQPSVRRSLAISADGDSSGADDVNVPRDDATGPSRLLTTRFQLSRSAYRVSLTYVPDAPWARQRAFTSLFTSTSQVCASKPNRRHACARVRLRPGRSRYSRSSRRSTCSKVDNFTLHSVQHYEARLAPMRLVNRRHFLISDASSDVRQDD
jgi:hypothetical protein